jgi:hypothetical protein
MNIRVLLAEGLKDAQKASERMHWCNNINAIKIRFLIIIVNLKGRNPVSIIKKKANEKRNRQTIIRRSAPLLPLRLLPAALLGKCYVIDPLHYV